MSAATVLRADWPAPPGVQAVFTLRAGGVSNGAYRSLNLGAHVGDEARAVQENRRRVIEALTLPSEPLWLAQVHGTEVVRADEIGAGAAAPNTSARGDASVTQLPGRVLSVLVADCLPVLLARTDGSAVAIAHAGWRGLAGGVIEAAVRALGGTPQSLLAWLGPAIGPAHFEVGEEVRTAFCRHDPQAQRAFAANARARWQCDLHQLAVQRLAALGVQSVHGRPRCTFSDADSFYSFRRDGVTGRAAALIWIDARVSPTVEQQR
ncbi:MAG TPA: peptidoglycan editing factor PgeF [Steroidobacteraceae bacterium]